MNTESKGMDRLTRAWRWLRGVNWWSVAAVFFMLGMFSLILFGDPTAGSWAVVCGVTALVSVVFAVMDRVQEVTVQLERIEKFLSLRDTNKK